jgi:type IV secretory pathway TraG/TraD family ATPase VirD4
MQQKHHPGLLVVVVNAIIASGDTPLGHYAIIVPIVAGLAALGIMKYDERFDTRRTHGSAHHASGKEASQYRAPRSAKLPTVGKLWRDRRSVGHLFRLGKYQGRVVGLSEHQQYEHILLTAPTGSGKSSRVLIPCLLRETGARSLFIADLKNELYVTTSGWLNKSMPVWRFAPIDPAASAGYNPLAHIRSVEDAQDFAETWVANTGTSSKESFWETNSKLLISALTMHLVESEQSPAFSRLADIITTQSFDEIKALLTKTRSRSARYIAQKFLENMASNERLVGSQMTDVGNRFQLLVGSNARTVTARNDINFVEMRQTPTAFFLSIPRSETRRYRPLLAVLVHQMFAAWERGGTQSVQCYLDEFTNMGYLPGYADFISLARAQRIGLCMAIQGFAQLTERYGKNDAETIKANAVTHLLLPGAGLEECRYYSERLGDETVATTTVNRRGTGFAQEITSSQSEARRRLMTPDELRTMELDQMLMLQARSAPLVLTTTAYYEDKELAGRANLQSAQVQAPPLPSAPPARPRSLPSPAPSAPPIVVDADEDDDQFFQP